MALRHGWEKPECLGCRSGLHPEPQRDTADRPTVPDSGSDDPTDHIPIRGIGRRRGRRPPRGDRNSPEQRHSGAGGGGSGGGLRISCVGAYVQGATGQINAAGINGANASNSSGAGGSGSGGEVWIQSLLHRHDVRHVAHQRRGASAPVPSRGPDRLLEPGVGRRRSRASFSSSQPPGPRLPTSTSSRSPTPTTGAVYSNPPFIYAGGMVTGQGRSGPALRGTCPRRTTPTQSKS